MQQFLIQPQTCVTPPTSAFQYQGMWIQAPTLNGGQIMDSSSAPKMHSATITELKPKSVANIVCRIENKKKMPL
jgi:hypothetical protein